MANVGAQDKDLLFVSEGAAAQLESESIFYMIFFFLLSLLLFFL